MPNWKSLFIKNEEQEEEKKDSGASSFSFPVNTTPNSTTQNPVTTLNDPMINEVLQVYENGLDSINMPGYDFFEFYKMVISTGNPGDQTYNMAFQMARTLDKTITPSKLLTDAEFYISKINEVHSQYVNQGQQKLNAIEEKKKGEKNSLQGDIDRAAMRITQLRAELQQLEADIAQKKKCADESR